MLLLETAYRIAITIVTAIIRKTASTKNNEGTNWFVIVVIPGYVMEGVGVCVGVSAEVVNG